MMDSSYTLDLSAREFVLLYLLLKGKDCPDPGLRERISAKLEKRLFEHLTIADIENIEDFFRKL